MKHMQYITIPQLAKMMGVNRVTIYRKVKTGQIKATKIGHSYIIEDDEIKKALGQKLTQRDKKLIDKAVKKVVREYGQVLKLLGRE